MSPPATPYIQIIDPDDLALSEEDEDSESPAEATRSPSTLGNDSPLISRSYADEKTLQAASSSQGRFQIIGWMIANTIATIGSVRSGSLPLSRKSWITRSRCCRSSLISCSSEYQRSDMISSALRHTISSLQVSCSAYFRVPYSAASRQRESGPSKCCHYLYHCV